MKKPYDVCEIEVIKPFIIVGAQSMIHWGGKSYVYRDNQKYIMEDMVSNSKELGFHSANIMQIDSLILKHHCILGMSTTCACFILSAKFLFRILASIFMSKIDMWAFLFYYIFVRFWYWLWTSLVIHWKLSFSVYVSGFQTFMCIWITLEAW